MDIEAFKKYAIPEDEADKMVRVIRKTIKSIRNRRQDVEEKQKDIFMTKIKIQKELEQEEQEDLPALPAPEQAALPAPEQAALPAPEQAALPAQQIVDLDAGFSPKELATFEKYKLAIPSKVYLESFKDDGLINQVMSESAKLNQKIGRRKGGLNEGPERDGLSEDIKIIRKYRSRLRGIEEGKNMLKTGSGVIYYKNPRDLMERLELLSGEIKAGNNSSDIKNEFSEIAHTLRLLNIISESQLNKLLEGNIFTL